MDQRIVNVILGVSGSGKSTISRELALQLGSTWMQSDDLRIAFHAADVSFNQGLPTPLHFDRTPVAAFLASDPDEMCQRMIDVAIAMLPAVQVVVENHVLQSRPMVIEGDSIHPDLIRQPGIKRWVDDGHVAFCCLAPASEDALRDIMLRRAGREATLTFDQVASLARFQWRYSEWLVERCRANGIPIVDSLPRWTLIDRVRAEIIDILPVQSPGPLAGTCCEESTGA